MPHGTPTPGLKSQKTMIWLESGKLKSHKDKPMAWKPCRTLTKLPLESGSEQALKWPRNTTPEGRTTHLSALEEVRKHAIQRVWSKKLNSILDQSGPIRIKLDRSKFEMRFPDDSGPIRIKVDRSKNTRKSLFEHFMHLLLMECFMLLWELYGYFWRERRTLVYILSSLSFSYYLLFNLG